MSRLEYWAFGHGYCGKCLPRAVRKLCARTALHRAWLSGHNYCKWGWKTAIQPEGNWQQVEP